jgi:predicted glycosyltransferase
MKVWIDVDNPAQVQYLIPFRAAFEAAGAETVVTARDNGSVVELLAQARVEAATFGKSFGGSKMSKASGLARRARELSRFLIGDRAPDALLAASRSAAIVARRLRIPSFIVGDYEWANVSVYVLTGSTILYPDVIDPAAFRRRGLRRRQLQPFRGLKEDISFSGIDVESIGAYDLGFGTNAVARVLFRPPLETSHYYRPASGAMAKATLRHLADLDVQVVLSPRQPAQASYLDGIGWRHPPKVLEHSVPFVPLLKSVDAVVCSGGTMLREAAYLGVPSYSIFQSRLGGVDRWLADIGRVVLVHDAAELEKIAPTRRGPLDPLDSNPRLIDELVELILRSSARLTAVTEPTSATARVSSGAAS